MSDPVKLNITKIGLESALNADINGVEVKLAKIKFSTNRFASVPNDPRTTLTNVVHESAISAGGTSIEQNTLRLFTVVNSASAYDIGSIGLYTEDDVLFAIASVETGVLLKIMPRISFIMSFGMTLVGLLLDNINVIIDQETALAAALIFQHEDHPDPHPQYTGKFNDLASDIDDLETEIEELKQTISTTYPKNIIAGVGTGAQVTINTAAKVPDMRDNRYSILLTPEGAHEAWSITRNLQGFTYNVWHRSGTNRIGYSGQVSWAVVQNSADFQIGGNGEYTIAGIYQIPVLAGEKKKIIIMGGGGGGGGSRYGGGTNYEANNGKNGQDTKVTLGGAILAAALGGKGGTLGIWSNGSAYNNGAAGEGGQFTFNASAVNTLISSTQGVAGNATRANHTGGVLSADGGDGGDGINGVGDEGWSFGGGGGTGSKLEFNYHNTSNSPITLVLTVGEGGLQPAGSTNVGENGGTGYARVSTV